MEYDYYKAVKDDVIDFIYDRMNDSEYQEIIHDKDELAEKLSEDCWAEDSVTGNGSGSYTFSRAEAREYVFSSDENLELLVDALTEYGCGPEDFKRALTDPEYADTTIRCYVLDEAIWKALEQLEFEGVLNFSVSNNKCKPKAKGKPKTKNGINRKKPAKKKAPAKKKPVKKSPAPKKSLPKRNSKGQFVKRK